MRRTMPAFYSICLAFMMIFCCGAAAVPAHGAERQMVIGIPGLPDNADCQNTSSVYNRIGLNQQIYDYLLRKDGEGKIQPHLVESYEFAEDASSCTMKLKKGIKFWDGTGMTAKDVQYTIARAKTATGSVKGYCSDISHAEVIDDHTFKIVMGNPNVALLEYLTVIPIMSADFTEACGKEYGTDVDKIMGSGPYMVKEWKFGEYMVFEAFEDFVAGPPPVKSILLKVISDTNAAVIALQTGEVDLYLNDVPYISLADLESARNVQVDYFSSPRYNYVLFNAESGMFSDVRMRHAVAYAVDREEMLIIGCEDLENGFLVNSPAGPDFTANPGFEKWPFALDAGKAAQLVKEAGNEGREVVVYTLTVDPYPKLATKLQDFLSKIGLKSSIVQMENSAYVNDICKNGKFEIAICFNNFPAKDMDVAISAQLHTSKAGMSGNYGRYRSSEMDRRILEAKVITDPEKRKEAYQKVLDLFAGDVPSVPLYFAKSSRAYSSALKVEPNCAQYDKFYLYSWK